MKDLDIYQSPQADVTEDVMQDSEVKLWMPQAKMLAEQGKSEVTIRQFFKQKGIDESLVSQAAKLAFQSGNKAKNKGKRPYVILGSIFIITAIVWMLYTLFVYGKFFWLPLILAAIGFGLVNGTYLRDKR